MRKFYDVVKEVSDKFLEEARQSPQLIADMAKMEYYMAESYSGRLFIELLQNADDAKSTRIISFYNNNNLYFANNGKPFDENDLIAISRSGASEKKRGTTIGYRGIGFKSASAISNDIIIYSANTYFTFSKEKCSNILKMKLDEVPTIRIPILMENVDESVQDDIQLLKDNGYSTIFVFKNVDIALYLDELNEVNEGYFIFLNNICECIFDIEQTSTKYEMTRYNDFGNSYVKISEQDKETEWMLAKNKNATVAFLLDEGVIVPCEEEQAVYHCYLPTLERSIISCKINADFSTDPSRKHITMDDKTKESLSHIGYIFGSVLESAFKDAESGKYKNILNMYMKKTTISKINIYLNDIIDKYMNDKKWIQLGNGEFISPKEYKTFPSSFDIEKPESVRAIPGEISENSLAQTVYENIDNVEAFFEQYSTEKMDLASISKDLSNEEYVEKLNPEIHTQLLTSAIRESKIEQALNPEYQADLKSYIVKTDENKYKSFDDIIDENECLDKTLKQELGERLGTSEINWLQKQVGADSIIKESAQDSISAVEKNFEEDDTDNLTIHIAKWRDAENKCVQIEEYLGNKATDVSIKNYGYDVESTTPEGKKRYIEVKSVKGDFSFSLTNNEYTAAHQYGDEYFICLLLEKDNDLEVRYIQNPLNNAKFEKRIKQWEWLCLECTSTAMTFNLD